jgi:hypothetical protein
VVSWCTKKYIPGQRIIPLRDQSLVSLSAQAFHEMLKLLEPTLTFIGQGCKQFLKKHHNGLDIISDFFEELTNTFREIAWLFTRITGQASMASISHIIIYILYFTDKEQFIFDWGS